MTDTSAKSKRPAPPADRVRNAGLMSERKKPIDGPKELTPKMKLLVEYQLTGCPHRDILQRIKKDKAIIDEHGNPQMVQVSPEPGEPLTLKEAAILLGIRVRYAKELGSFPLFQKYAASELQKFRDGEKFASVHRIVALRDDKGEGKAADRKVQLAAAQAILGEPEGSRGGTTVNVFNGGNQVLSAGIVIRIRADAPETPLDQKVIDHDGRD